MQPTLESHKNVATVRRLLHKCASTRPSSTTPPILREPSPESSQTLYTDPRNTTVWNTSSMNNQLNKNSAIIIRQAANCNTLGFVSSRIRWLNNIVSHAILSTTYSFLGSFSFACCSVSSRDTVCFTFSAKIRTPQLTTNLLHKGELSC